jgi:hypothetical protein
MAEDSPYEVELSGELGQLASVVQSADITISLGTGQIKDGPTILVPFMTCQLNGKFGREDEPAEPNVTLAYDNVAFLLMQFSEEYLQALDVLDLVAPGGLGAALPRLTHAAEWLQDGGAAMQRAAQRLNALAQRLDPQQQEEAVDGEASNPAKSKRRTVRLRRRADTSST